MRALILTQAPTAVAPADTPATPLRDPRPGSLLNRHLRALAAAGFREIVVAASSEATPLAETRADAALLGLRLQTCSDIGSQGESVERTLPLLGAGPFALIFARVRTDYPLTRLRALKCDWAHLVLVPAQQAGRASTDAARLQLQGARVVAGPADPSAPAFSGIAVCHPRLFADGRGPLLERFHRAARDHLVTAELWRGDWSDPEASS